MILILFVTRKYKEYFNGNAIGYAQAVGRWTKDHPAAGICVRLCYAAFLLKVVLLAIIR
ncbi:hypothetical protein [Hydrogenophaga sp.]|uniref:hypothetical protein n=1 Tax=Hydrogenophaga sp. TaxID=1904254 RepID=UPI0027227763|nr:hypothetical protein [Hydrogenophaga sp.]MDO9434965.1 hypothetical protein [Hydrogenophaga sp.]